MLRFQRLWRGVKGRSKAIDRRKQKMAEFEFLQAQVRKRAQEEHDAKEATVLQHHERAWERIRWESATAVQAWFRACKERRGVIKEVWAMAEMKDTRQRLSARKMQWAYRLRLAWRGKYAAQVTKDMQHGRSAGVRGTPTIFVNGRKYQGRRSVQGFERVLGKSFGLKVKP